jgi:hypothetical protein
VGFGIRKLGKTSHVLFNVFYKDEHDDLDWVKITEEKVPVKLGEVDVRVF